jgi:hypothetical protein
MRREGHEIADRVTYVADDHVRSAILRFCASLALQ